MANSLSPAFVKINYTSPYGAHTMTIPTVPLNNVGVVNTPPNFDLRGAAVDVDADAAIRAFLALLKVYAPTNITFVDYVIYSQPTTSDAPLPVYSESLGITGDTTANIASKACQQTMTFRADNFTLYKFVMLDFVPALGFEKQVTITNPNLEAVRAYIVADVTWFASRGGGRPNTFLQMATTLNEKLRRSYGMN